MALKSHVAAREADVSHRRELETKVNVGLVNVQVASSMSPNEC